MDLVAPTVHANARQLFNLAEKTKVLEHVPWT